MPEFAKSLSAASWAVSVFGAQQALNLVSRDGQVRAKAEFYAVTTALQEEFSGNPFFYAIDQLGEGTQDGAVDLFFDALQLKPLGPDWLRENGGRFLRAWLDAAIALAPAENLEATINQIRNTLNVIRLVNLASATLDLPAGQIDLGAAVERAYRAGGDYASLWLIEGLGEEYATRNWTSSRPPQGLLTTGRGSALPEKSLLMMHAGIGIAFARRMVKRLTPYSPEAEVAEALREFIHLVRGNARPGYEGPALESLGLVTRTWYPQMIPPIDRELWRLDIEALEYFWHGAGRATYFTPQYLLPGASPFQGVTSLAPHELGRRNGVAGAAWAYVLVNIRQPSVILNLLKRQGEALARDDAFSNGAASTAMMALDMIPGDADARRLAEYRPETTDAGMAELWDRMIHLPCRCAVDSWFPILKRRGELGGVFRYQNLQRLTGDAGGQS